MSESLTRLIQSAQGDRGRLKQILLRVQSGEQFQWRPTDWSLMAKELQRLGCFAQVLELCDLAEAAGVEDFNLLARAATAASNLGLSGDYVEKLERAAATLPEHASAEVIEEVLGGLGRQYKAWALLVDDDGERERLLRKSLCAYQRAYASTLRLWSGVNVASVSLLLGDHSRAAALAERLAEDASQRFRDAMAGAGDEESHWLKAIQGECALILGQLDVAATHYAMARALAERRRRLGDIASMRRQARLLLRESNADELLALEWLPLPRIAVFSGHRVDAPDRLPPRLPPKQLNAVASAIQAWFAAHQARIAVCSLSAGSDLLFAESALRAGAELHLLLPAGRRELTRLALIEHIPDGAARITQVLGSATSVRELAPAESSCEVVDYVYLNEMILGTAEFLRQAVDGVISGLSVWDGSDGAGPGGSVDGVRRMRECGWPVTRIDPGNAKSEPVAQVPAASAEFVAVSAQLKALVFGDFVGFSRLDGAGLKDFHAQVLATVGRCVDAVPPADAPFARNTWGDGLYLAFPSVLAAARFGLDLQAALAELAGRKGGVASQVRLRLAVHFGPTTEVIDPVTRQPNVIGTHVSLAARLEPATAPGEVYASEAFAARLMLERDSGLECRYLKNLPWAKNYGVFPTFRLVARAR